METIDLIEQEWAEAGIVPVTLEELELAITASTVDLSGLADALQGLATAL